MAEISRLPGPVADLWDWQLADVPPREPGRVLPPRGRARPGAGATATPRPRPVCAACPVLAQCRAHALAGARAVRRLGRADRGRARGGSTTAIAEHRRLTRIRLTAPPDARTRLAAAETAARAAPRRGAARASRVSARSVPGQWPWPWPWPTGRSGVLVLRLLDDEGVGREDHRRDRRGVAQRRTGDLDRVDDAGLDEVAVLAGGRVETLPAGSSATLAMTT